MQKNVAITGATGLLGAHLANHMLSQGYNVFGLIKDENSKSILSRDVTRIYGNINVRSDIEYFIQKANPHIFIHLAAQTQAYDSLTYPYQTFYNNIVGTLNVLECLREYGKSEAILVASSDKAYGELITQSYLEDHPLNGIYPYDASKSATDLLSSSYRLTYEMPIVITRACNIYGIGDFNRQRLIPRIISCFKNDEIFTARNGGLDLREYIHVDDVVLAYEKIISYVTQGGKIGAFNISSGDRKQTIQVFELVQELIGHPIRHEILADESFEIKKQFMDSRLLSLHTGWKPKHSLESSLMKVIEWYQLNL